MVKRIFTLLFFLCLMDKLQAQDQYPLLQTFQEALKYGELALVEPLLHTEVNFRLGNKAAQSLAPKDVLHTLASLIKELSPELCEVRHHGESASGQVYAMGRLEGAEGTGYSWLVRAQSEAEDTYRIIQLELDPD